MLRKIQKSLYPKYKEEYEWFYMILTEPELALDLIAAGQGEIIETHDKGYKIIPKYQYTGIEDCLFKFYGAEFNFKNFLLFVDIHVRKYCNKHKLELNDYIIPFNWSLLLIDLDKNEYNISDVIESVENFFLERKDIDMRPIDERTIVNYLIENGKLARFTIDKIILDRILSENSAKYQEYKDGKIGLINFFFGQYLKNLVDKNINKDLLFQQLKATL